MTTPKAKLARGVTLTDVEATAAGELIQRGARTIDQTAADLGVHRRTLLRKFAKMGIDPKANPVKVAEAAKVAASATAAELIGDPLERAKHIRETKDSFRRVMMLGQRVGVKILTDQIRANLPIDALGPKFKALDIFGNAMRKFQDGAHKALGIDTVDNDDGAPLPELIVAVLGPQEMKQLQDKHGHLGDDLGLGLDATENVPGLDFPDDDGIVIEGEPEDGTH